MKTTDLIELLAKDVRPAIPLNHVLAHSAIAGILITGIAFFALIGFRPDIIGALASGRFLFKFVVTLALAISSATLLMKAGKPGVIMGTSKLHLLIPIALLASAAVVEIVAMPPETWAARAVGHNAMNCLTIIPALSIGPLACFIYGLKRGAPEPPGMAGLIAGLTAAGIAATFYASNCDDDSPLFVLLWYPIAVAAVALVGYVAGRRLLRW